MTTWLALALTAPRGGPSSLKEHTMQQHTVRPGQIWADNDKRSYGRQVRIESIDATHATVLPVTVTPQGAVALLPGRPTRIRLDRFKPTSTGYRLVTEAPE